MDAKSPESRLRTFAAATALFTPAASSTDIFVIGGSATKTIRLLRLLLSGTQTTAGNIGQVAVVKRSTANTGGTAVAATAVALDSDPVKPASALVQHYTANPTTGTLVGAIWQKRCLLPAPASVADGVLFDLDFTQLLNGKLPVLRGLAEQFAINLGGGTLPTGAAEFQVTAFWSEQ